MPPYIAPEEVQREGYWGVPTSTLDFCEENYISTFFVAELCEFKGVSTLVRTGLFT